MLLSSFGSLRSLVCVVGFFLLLAAQSFSAEPGPDSGVNSDDPTGAPNLAASQEAIEMRYRRFEGTLQQLSEYLRKSDPSRAELLVRAIGKSKEGRIPEQLQHLTELLKKDQLGDAVERQEFVVAELQTLLELLMSEARKDDLEREKKRIQELIKDVSKLIGKETDARAETERGGKPSDLQNQQKQVTESTQKLIQRIESQDAAKKTGKTEKGANATKPSGKPDEQAPDQDEQKPGDPDPGDPDSKQSEKPPSEPKEDSQESEDDPEKGRDKQHSDKPSDEDPESPSQEGKNSKPGKQKPGEAKKPGKSKKGDEQSEKPQEGKPQEGKPQQGKPKKGKPQQGTPQDGQPPEQPPQDNQDQDDSQEKSPESESGPKKQPDKTAGREELERAKLEMDRAIEELKKNNKKGASDKQDKAIAELMKAKEKLEEILRQLREEEKELVLAQMESRFRDMLIKQEAVNNATLAIHAVAVDNRTDRHRNRAVELARNEEEISLLAAKALTLLKEEGSSIAFPEAVEQIREDMLTVARRLERVEVGEITQNIEQDIVESLKEIIEALQKELEKLKDKKQQQQKQQKQQQQQQGLVNQLAEMKMLRSLQYRVNRRTKQLGRLVDGEQAVDADIIGQLKQLSDRQAKVQKATYDLSTGKNQ